ncbi:MULTISPECIES: bacterial proteasome activator family protein [unclassified Frankia]|uniref:bacterial proteasome activator family protein n=1 Tax=unclassified Frankia TaxID=2632575 RepID=UPI002AD59DA8|nr:MULTISPECIES: bacterial proteasome activator family protein [unclassified Frankia]
MADQPDPRVVIVGPDGAVDTDTSGARPRIVPGAIGSGIDASHVTDGEGDQSNTLMEMVSQPDKVMRIGAMIKQLLEEVRAAPLDEASRLRLREIHRNSIRELSDGLAPELQSELGRLTLPFDETQTPSDAELRIAQAQLVGWLEGLFHGIQTALFAQQMAARAQLEEMRRRALPSGSQSGEQFGRGAYL